MAGDPVRLQLQQQRKLQRKELRRGQKGQKRRGGAAAAVPGEGVQGAEPPSGHSHVR